MIPHADFHKLRLIDFASGGEIVALSDWEFDDRMWIGEAMGFSEWLRPEGNPDWLESLALGEELSPTIWSRVLQTLRLPLKFGMSREAVEETLGTPEQERHHREDRVSLEFAPTASTPYRISCTVRRDHGLIYLVMTIPEQHRRRSFT